MEFLLIWEVLAVMAAVAAAAIWLRSTLVKQRHKELEDLADTRGERIHDLHTEITELRAEMNELRGELNAIKNLKMRELAEVTAAEVVVQLRPSLEE